MYANMTEKLLSTKRYKTYKSNILNNYKNENFIYIIKNEYFYIC